MPDEIKCPTQGVKRVMSRTRWSRCCSYYLFAEREVHEYNWCQKWLTVKIHDCEYNWCQKRLTVKIHDCEYNWCQKRLTVKIHDCEYNWCQKWLTVKIHDCEYNWCQKWLTVNTEDTRLRSDVQWNGCRSHRVIYDDISASVPLSTRIDMRFYSCGARTEGGTSLHGLNRNQDQHGHRFVWVVAFQCSSPATKPPESRRLIGPVTGLRTQRARRSD